MGNMTERSNESPLGERLKAKVKRAVGSVLGDDALRHEGDLHDEKADALVQAAELADAAALDDREAELARRAEHLDAEQRMLGVDAATDARAQHNEQDQQLRALDTDQRRRAEDRAAEASARVQRDSVVAEEAGSKQRNAEALVESLRLQADADRARSEAEVLDVAVRTMERS